MLKIEFSLKKAMNRSVLVAGRIIARPEETRHTLSLRRAQPGRVNRRVGRLWASEA